MKIEDFFLLSCRFTSQFLVAMGLTTAQMCDKISLWCRNCGHYHEFTLKKDGTFKVRTY